MWKHVSCCNSTNQIFVYMNLDFFKFCVGNFTDICCRFKATLNTTLTHNSQIPQIHLCKQYSIFKLFYLKNILFNQLPSKHFHKFLFMWVASSESAESFGIWFIWDKYIWGQNGQFNTHYSTRNIVITFT